VLEVPLLLALAALDSQQSLDVSEELKGLARHAGSLLNTLYHEPMSLGEALVRHGIFRYNVASVWASMRGRSAVHEAHARNRAASSLGAWSWLPPS
jgi:hypothetical protein